MFFVKKYSIEDKVIWDEFVSNSKNKHFFFFRQFMEYHSERFEDHSLMIYDEAKVLVALLPANISENEIISHQGLTFGGFLVKSSMKQSVMLSIFEAVINYVKNLQLSSFIYKRIPYIYHILPSDEDLYALFINDFKLFRRDVSSSIILANQISYSKGRKWLVNKAKKSELEIVDESDISEFWELLASVLDAKHGVRPVHSEKEILSLSALFPKNIKFHSVRKDGDCLAGCVLFVTENTVHTQYLFNTVVGREIGALDYLIDRLVKEIYTDFKYFDFGISNEQQGRYLNEGLIAQKEGFGARAVCHEFYKLDI